MSVNASETSWASAAMSLAMPVLRTMNASTPPAMMPVVHTASVNTLRDQTITAVPVKKAGQVI